MGRMRLSVGPGTHEVEASFERTPVCWIADLTSLAALLALIASWPWRKEKGPRERP
jgi:hypothetical protein